MQMMSLPTLFLLLKVLTAIASRHEHLGFHHVETPDGDHFLARNDGTGNVTKHVKDPEWDGDSIQENRTYDKDYPDDGNPQPGPSHDYEAIAMQKVEKAEKEVAEEKNDLAKAKAKEKEEEKELDEEKAKLIEEKAEKQEAKEELEEALDDSKEAKEKMIAAKKECDEAEKKLKTAEENTSNAKAAAKEEKSEHKDVKAEVKDEKAEHAEAKDVRKEAEEELKEAEKSLEKAQKEVRSLKGLSCKASMVSLPLLALLVWSHL